MKDLEALSYAIEPRYRIGLEEFARTTVVPIYESRPRTSPEEAIAAEEEDGGFEDISETFGAYKMAPKDPPVAASAPPAVIRLGSPVWFIGGLAGAVALLAGLALLKFVMSDNGAPETPSQVLVELWIPSDSKALLDNEVVLHEKGRARLDSGHTQMKVTFDSGRQVACEFVAAEGLEVRMVHDSGRDGISLNDGPFQPCKELTTATSPEGARPASP